VSRFNDLSGPELFLAVTFMLALVAAGLALSGLLIWMLWNWGVTMVWENAPHLSFWKATIAAVLITLFRNAFFGSRKSVE